MVRLNMVPHRGMPVVVVHVSERDRRGSESGYDEDSKNLLESVFHGNPGGKVRLVSVEKRDAKPEATVIRRHFNAVNEAARLLNSRRVPHRRRSLEGTACERQTTGCLTCSSCEAARTRLSLCGLYTMR